ncbi:MAG TPA: hypothetical protein VHV31_05650 [Nitrolancea sp.]|nr:hypothetical protein [Nitrolancea sp.]
MGADDPQAVWLPSSNFDPGRNGASIDRATTGDFSDAFYGATGGLVSRLAHRTSISLDRTHGPRTSRGRRPDSAHRYGD